MPSVIAEPPLRFGRFEIRPAERLLRLDGEPMAIGGRAFDLLLVLVQRRERLVTKQELLDLVWPGLVVEEHNIAAQISSLRKALGAQVIATVAGRGYRFTATVDPAPAPAQPLAGEGPPPRHNLPEPRTRFIGREAALAELAQLWPGTRLLTLTGMGGSGKTRLALQFAQRQLAACADGVWFVDLAPLRTPARVASACAAVLGLDADAQDDTPALAALAARLAPRQALIVLDNCEHVREGAAALADALLARPGRARILATSREPLGVAGEQRCPVGALALPASLQPDEVRAAEAVRVFVDRARLARPDFDVDSGNAASLVEICRRLDGNALAIELAAARVTMLSVSDLATRLEDRFRLLDAGSAAAGRGRTLLATMQWSYDLLEPAAQRLLRHLAVFRGGCTLAAATAVAQAADEYEALALLTALHDKSLLGVERGAAPDGGAGVPRYTLLETVRQYAQERLEACGETAAARARHVAHCLALAEAAAPELDGPAQSAWMARLREEHENLVAAMGWCGHEASPVDAAMGLRLAAATGRYWLFHAIELGSELTLAILQRGGGAGDSAARCEALLALAAMCMHRGRGDEGLPHARDALAIARRLGAAPWEARALGVVGACLGNGGDEADALRHFEQARDLAQATGSAYPLMAALNNIATIAFRRGDLAAAEAGFRQALHLARARGDVRGALIFLHNRLRTLVALGRPADAHACAVEAEGLLRGVGEEVLKLELLEVAAGLASISGEHELAARLWGFSLQRFVDAGYRRPPEDQAQLDRLWAASREALGPEAFARAEAAGRALGTEGAMQALRRWLGQGPGSAAG